ncbi:hypothetical protein GPUN_0528 [Glaciecola punicea ACAM 611]|uniref:Uncharacterized protein n=1 Tax=Glaciecola punicea ACAM 611 TaxID=1121923 RepID=H5T8P7_9ALTE|nr:hypothetical protein GPUN_0528 [Glaciecola punicea ACAM 611]
MKNAQQAVRLILLQMIIVSIHNKGKRFFHEFCIRLSMA